MRLLLLPALALTLACTSTPPRPAEGPARPAPGSETGTPRSEAPVGEETVDGPPAAQAPAAQAPAAQAPARGTTPRDLPEVLAEVLEQEAERLPAREGGLRVAVGDLGYGPHRIPTPFARILAEELSQVLTRNPRLVECARQELDQVLSEQERALSDLYSGAGDGPALGELALVNGVFTGSYELEGDELVVRLRLLDTETGVVLFSTSARSLLPASRRDYVRPAELVDIEQAVTTLTPARRDDFGCKLWVDRGERASYRFGEEMKVYFRAEEDCYLKLYHVDARGRVQVIYPNEHTAGQKVLAGQVLVLPDAAYSFRVGEPAGIEILFAEASTTPFRQAEPAYSDLGARRDLAGIRTRGIEVVAQGGPPTRRSSARCMVSISEL